MSRWTEKLIFRSSPFFMNRSTSFGVNSMNTPIPVDRIAADEVITERHRDVEKQWKRIYSEDASVELDRRNREERAAGLDGTIVLY